jgi:hypothetical protein
MREVRYALFQLSLEIPPVDRLVRAFESVRALTAIDAPAIANDAYGILVRNLSANDAHTLHRALEAESVPTEIVPENLVPALPPTKFVRRFEFGADSLLIHDPLGRPVPLPWGQLRILAVGSVTLTRFEEQRIPRPAAHTFVAHRYGRGLASRVIESTPETRRREVRSARTVMELIAGRGVARFTVEVEQTAPTLFAALGTDRQNDLDTNVSLLVRRLAAAAPRALLNRGAFFLRENPLVATTTRPGTRSTRN